MCYGDIAYGSDGYYRDWAIEQEREWDQEHDEQWLEEGRTPE